MNKVCFNKYFLLLVLLIATDIAFIVLGFFYECGRLELIGICQNIALDSYFSIARDRGYAEVFQYFKIYWIILLFGFLIINRKARLYLSWFFLFIYLLLDDMGEIHEKMGELIGDRLNIVTLFNLRPQDYGELIFSSVVGISFLLLIGISYRLANSQERFVFKHLILLLFMLAAFGIVIDLIHNIFNNNKFWEATFILLEDGGEHIVMSLITCFIFSKVDSFEKPKVSASKNLL